MKERKILKAEKPKMTLREKGLMLEKNLMCWWREIEEKCCRDRINRI